MTAALQERIARALARQDGYDPDEHCDEWVMDGMRESAAAVLPIVEAEVRAAKAEALREAVRDMGEWADEGLVVTGDEHDESTWLERTVGEWLTDRATEYETGDRA